jgi:hypothetical protein
VRTVARSVLWPLRRFFDPRFTGIAAQIGAEAHDTRAHIGALIADNGHELLRMQAELADTLMDLRRLAIAEMDAGVEASALVGEALGNLIAEVEAIRQASGASFDQLREGGVEHLDASAAALLNHADSHEGFAAERNLWFNWPLSLEYEAGDVHVGGVNERIVEVAYALGSVSQLQPGTRILDVGPTESTLALSLASLGFSVTALDPRPYPLTHPNLQVEVGTIEDWESDGRFAGVLCISTLEHIGSGEYGQAAAAKADTAALERLHGLTEQNGLLVLTTPYGRSHDGDGARVYDRARLEALLADWRIEDFTVVGRQDATTWVPTEGGEPVGEAVALITARRDD